MKNPFQDVETVLLSLKLETKRVNKDTVCRWWTIGCNPSYKCE